MHRMSSAAAALFTRLLVLLLVLALLLSAACTRGRGPAPPDLVLFASGAIFGQLETCG